MRSGHMPCFRTNIIDFTRHVVDVLHRLAFKQELNLFSCVVILPCIFYSSSTGSIKKITRLSVTLLCFNFTLANIHRTASNYASCKKARLEGSWCASYVYLTWWARILHSAITWRKEPQHESKIGFLRQWRTVLAWICYPPRNYVNPGSNFPLYKMLLVCLDPFCDV